MKLKSPAFKNNGFIPVTYTCDGKNISPPLEFLDIPKDAKSLVLIMEDPDVPKNIKPDGMWDHWILWNIKPNIRVIGEGNSAGLVGKNTRGNLNYGGPCPLDREHRYFFKLFAVDTVLSFPEGSSKKEVLNAINHHIIDKAELIGRYKRLAGPNLSP